MRGQNLTVTIEVLEPLALQYDGQVTNYEPGDQVCLPAAAARDLLRLAEGLVRVMGDVPLQVGEPVTWESSKGRARAGTVVFAAKDGWMILRERGCSGALAWVVAPKHRAVARTHGERGRQRSNGC